MSTTARTRIDSLMVQKGLVPSRERARALLLAGRVLVSEQKVDKPGAVFTDEVPIRILGEDLRYVSRGGLKLEAALEHWSIPVEGRACLDIGTSNRRIYRLPAPAWGGACLLRGYRLRTDRDEAARGSDGDAPRIKLYERTNARLLSPGSLPGNLTLLVMDVSFISATLVLPPVMAAAQTLTEAVVLVKPQFEAGRGHIGKGGIVRSSEGHDLAIARVRECMEAIGAQSIEIIDSPITGMEGNKEFLLHATLAQK